MSEQQEQDIFSIEAYVAKGMQIGAFLREAGQPGMADDVESITSGAFFMHMIVSAAQNTIAQMTGGQQVGIVYHTDVIN